MPQSSRVLHKLRVRKVQHNFWVVQYKLSPRQILFSTQKSIMYVNALPETKVKRYSTECDAKDGAKEFTKAYEGKVRDIPLT
jgi:hypothetical protein